MCKGLLKGEGRRWIPAFAGMTEVGFGGFLALCNFDVYIVSSNKVEFVMKDQLSNPSIEEQAARLQRGLAQLVNALISGLNEPLASFDIDSIDYTILKACTGVETITIKDLRKLVPVDYVQLSRSVSLLEDRGLVRKFRTKGDRRLVYVQVTEEGKVLLPKLVAISERYFTLLVKDIDAGELAGSIAVMEKMIGEDGGGG